MVPNQIDERIQDMQDGILSAEAFLELQDELRHNPDARETYRDYLHIQLGLQLRAQAAKHAMGISDVVPIDRIVRRQKRRAIRIAMVAAAAVLVLAGVVSLLIPAPAPPLANFKTGPSTVFALSLVGEGEAPPAGARVLEEGSRLTLSQGSVELVFASGVRGVLRAPAELTVMAEERVELAQGIAWFEVPQEAIGFQVETPEMLVTDLGTAFGVQSDQQHPDELHVFTGSVEISRGDLREVVGANDARRVMEPGGLEKIPFGGTPYLTELPKELMLPPHLHWSFDDLVADGDHPLAAGIKLARGSEDQGPVLVDGVDGKAVEFDGSNDSLVSDWRGIGGDAPRTVAFWLKIDDRIDPSAKFDRALLSWGARSGGGANAAWSIRATNTYPLRDRQPLGVIRPQLFLGAGWLMADAELEPGRWYHLAIAYAGEVDRRGQPKADVYVDGRRRESVYSFSSAGGSDVVDTDIEGGENSIPLMIGQSRTTSESCSTSIDELYIFESHLSGELVRLLSNFTEANPK